MKSRRILKNFTIILVVVVLMALAARGWLNVVKGEVMMNATQPHENNQTIGNLNYADREPFLCPL